MTRRSTGLDNYSSDDWEVELTDDGSVRVLHTGITSVQYGTTPKDPMLAPGALVVVRQAIAIAAAVGRETGYRGRWWCGVEVNGAAGALLPTDRWGRPIGGNPWSAPIAAEQDTSRRTRVATGYELEHSGWVVAADMLGRITRNLGVSELAVVKQILAAPAVSETSAPNPIPPA